VGCKAKFESRTKYKIDDAFAKRNGVEVPVAMSFAVKHKEHSYANTQSARSNGWKWGYLGFGFKSDGELVEEVWVSGQPFRGPSSDERLKWARGECQKKYFTGNFAARGLSCGEFEVRTESIGQVSVNTDSSESLSVRVAGEGHPAVRCEIACTSEKGPVRLVAHLIPSPKSSWGASILVYYYKEEQLSGGAAYILETFEFPE